LFHAPSQIELTPTNSEISNLLLRVLYESRNLHGRVGGGGGGGHGGIV